MLFSIAPLWIFGAQKVLTIISLNAIFKNQFRVF